MCVSVRAYSVCGCVGVGVGGCGCVCVCVCVCARARARVCVWMCGVSANDLSNHTRLVHKPQQQAEKLAVCVSVVL